MFGSDSSLPLPQPRTTCGPCIWHICTSRLISTSRPIQCSGIPIRSQLTRDLLDWVQQPSPVPEGHTTGEVYHLLPSIICALISWRGIAGDRREMNSSVLLSHLVLSPHFSCLSLPPCPCNGAPSDSYGLYPCPCNGSSPGSHGGAICCGKLRFSTGPSSPQLTSPGAA